MCRVVNMKESSWDESGRGGQASPPSHIVSRKTLRSSLLISRTLVSKVPCLVRALQRSLASRKARPNSLQSSSINVQLIGRNEAYFFRTSPKSNAAVTPTTIYVPAFSFRHATTKGKLFRLLPFGPVPACTLSRIASTSHNASRERTPG